jgi:N-acetylglucosaminyl-diphospho-decaprenol L-rhamnosyltransferase
MTSIIIVTYNSSDTIGALLVSIEKKFPVTLCEEKRNTGFSRACNRGARESRGDILLFLNPDVLLLEDILTPVVPLFHDTTIGVIGTSILNTDGSRQQSVRGLPTFSSHLLTLLKVHYIAPNLTPLKHYFQPDFDYTKEATVEQVMGAVFFTSKKIWDEMQGFDTRFFIWFEEVDYCYRIRQAGYVTRYTPLTKVQHIQGHSFSQVFRLKRMFWFTRSMVQYLFKNNL